MATKQTETVSEIQILELNQGEITFCILGSSPLIYEAMSDKGRRQLLMPRPRMNSAEKATNLKHDPLQEYRTSIYKNDLIDAPTRLMFLSAAFKKAAASAALDIPGAAKTQIGRLVWVMSDRVSMYGVPKMLMSITRSADINKTPDVRTRAILPEWACKITLRFMKPLLSERSIVNLMAAAGVIRGVGGWRQEKGSASYGQFQLVAADNPDFVRICAEGTRQAQDTALETPTLYDEETERLYAWYLEEIKVKGDRDAATKAKTPKKNGVAHEVY